MVISCRTFNLKLSTWLLLIAFLGCSLPLLMTCKGWTKESPHPQTSLYIKQLKTDKDWRKRSQAASALGEISQDVETVIPVLIEALNDEDEVVRLRATFALINFDLSAVPYLIQVLKNDNLAARASAAFALRQIGFSASPILTDALRSKDRRVRSTIVSTFREMAEDYENLPTSIAPSIPELKQAISSLEKVLSVLEPIINQKLIASEEFGVAQEDIREIRKSVIGFRNEIRNHQLKIAFRGLSWLLVLFFLTGVFIILYRPEILLRFSKTIILSREKHKAFERILKEVQQFLQQAGAQTSLDGKRSLKITSILGRLKPYVPLPVMLAIEQPIDQDVTELVKQSAKLSTNSPQQAGIFLYREPPDTIFRMRMAEVRLRDQFVLIPIPLAAVEKSLLEGGASTGLLAQYSERYLPGANLFDDRNAIGDTLAFFGRGELLQRLEENLRRSQGIGLFGLRKSGKTSILLQLGFSMRQHPVVHIDLQPYGGTLYYGAELFNLILSKLSELIKERTSKTLRNPNPFEPNCPAGELTADFAARVGNLIPKLKEAGYHLPILLFLDEIERIIPTKTDTKARTEEFNAFFGALRAISQETRSLSLLIADVHPDCNRINQWSQSDVPTNPVFNFFKEVFLFPFSSKETKRMLTDIGELMGVEFDEETLKTIHQESGGHPFVSRQLASLLSQKSTTSENRSIQWSTAQRYLQKTFTYSGILKNYFGQNVWGDLEKRNFTSAMAVLKLLSCNPKVIDQILLQKLNSDFTESECLDALLWLEAVGLVRREESGEHNSYHIKVPLMAHWLKMQMKGEEMQKWQLP